jgi:hypothetical protein
VTPHPRAAPSLSGVVTTGSSIRAASGAPSRATAAALVFPAAIAAALVFLAAPVSWSSASALHAQQIERERQEPLLPAAGIVDVDPELRVRLGLFPEVDGFRTARLLVRADGAAVLEIESFWEGRLERERRILDAPALAAFRSELEARLAEAAVPHALDREGRGGLVLSQTLIGLAYHGWAVPVALDVETARMGVGAYLLTGGTAFALPYFLTRDRPVSEAHRDLAFYGSTRGIGAGVLLGDVATPRDADAPERARLAGGVLLGLGGGAIGYAAAEGLRPDPGTAALWGAMGDFGFAAGATLAYVAGPYSRRTVQVVENGFSYTERRTSSPRLGHAITLAGGAAGLGAGGWMANRRAFSEGDVWALRSAGILGAQVGLTSGRIATDEGRPLAGAALAGGIGGLALGTRLLRDRHFTEGEGLLVAAGHLAGGATALGLTYLAIEDIGENELTYLATGTLGSLAGAVLVARALDPGSARTPSTSGSAPSPLGPEDARSPLGPEDARSPLGPEGGRDPARGNRPGLREHPFLDGISLAVHPGGFLLRYLF